MVAEKQVVYKKFPLPLINRLEKHTLTMKTILTPEQKHIAHELEMWAKEFVTSSPTQHRFVTFFNQTSHASDTIPSALVAQSCKFALYVSRVHSDGQTNA